MPICELLGRLKTVTVGVIVALYLYVEHFVAERAQHGHDRQRPSTPERFRSDVLI